MTENKILNHPDREEIIQKLLAGISPNVICDWLLARYPDDKKHQITALTISRFRTDYLNLNRDAARHLRAEKARKNAGLPNDANRGTFLNNPGESKESRALRVKESLVNNSPTYREKLKEVKDAHLDTPKLMKELHFLLQSRIETYYNEVAIRSNDGLNIKEDKMLLEYVRLATDVLKDSQKVWDDYNKQPDEGNVDLNVVHEQVGIIRDTIKDLLAEFAPELALEFMDRLNKRMTTLKYEAQKPPDILERVERLNKRIKEFQDRD